MQYTLRIQIIWKILLRFIKNLENHIKKFNNDKIEIIKLCFKKIKHKKLNQVEI